MSDLGDERVSAEEAIRRARANSDVPISYPSDAAEAEAVTRAAAQQKTPP